MKLLVFAHKPPPHHGQSYMVQRLLEALGGDCRAPAAPGEARTIQCYHVDCRVSADNEDVGRMRWGKLGLILKYCLRALGYRFRYGVKAFYFVPAFPMRAPVYRDWIVLGLCRPFFKTIIFHWHAVGLGEWLDTQARPWERWISRRLYARPTLSLILRPYNRADAEWVRSRRIEVVPNGIPDPCPRFEAEVLPRRLARVAARKQLLAGRALSASEQAAAGDDAAVLQVLFISLCYRGKGLFDLVEAIAQVNQQLPSPSLRVQLTVAGEFYLPAEQKEFEERIRQPDLLVKEPLVTYAGFVSGADKHRLLCASDVLCFPTRMAESFGLVLVESMAYGLPFITTNWRRIPELLPEGYPWVVEPQSPAAIAAQLLALLDHDLDQTLRPFFLAHYTDTKFAERMRRVLASLDGLEA